MIKREVAQDFLQQKKVKDILLQRLVKVKQLEGNAQLLGRLILNDVEEVKDEQNYTWHQLGDKRLAAITKLFVEELQGKNVWESELRATLVAIFDDWNQFVELGWQKMSGLMFQAGYYRRSYRVPNNPAIMLEQKIRWLIHLAYDLIYDLEITDYIRYRIHLPTNPTLCYLLAGAMDSKTTEGQQIFKVLSDVIYGNDTIGGVHRDLIKGLLLSNQKEAWQVVEKLLLAAQRQEGLRQTIFESLDETNFDAFLYFIKIIIDNKLTRFSSIVRSLDVWTGLNWEGAKEKTVHRAMSIGYEFLTNPQKIDTALKSKDNLEIYMALWASGCRNLEGTFPLIQQLLETGAEMKQAVAFWFLSSTGLPERMNPLAFPYLGHDNLMVAALALHNFSIQQKDNHSDTFDELFRLWQRTPIKGIDFPAKLFAWANHSLHRATIMSKIVDLIGDAEPERLAPYYDELDISSRESLGRCLEIRKTYNTAQRALIFKLLADKGTYVRDYAFKAIKKIKIKEADSEYIEAILTRKSGDLRVGIIQLLLTQEDKNLIISLNRLLVAKDVNQRLAGLDILHQLVKKDRLKTIALNFAKTYQERRRISEKEQLILSDILATDGVNYNRENGFGLYLPSNLTISPNPKPQPHLDFSWEEAKIFKAIKQLNDLIEANKEYEYEVENYDNSKTKTLIGNYINFQTYHYGSEKEWTPEQELADLPLSEIWIQWWESCGLSTWELWLMTKTDRNIRRYYHYSVPKWVLDIEQQFYKQLTFLKEGQQIQYWNQINRVVNVLSGVYTIPKPLETLLDVSEAIFATIPADKWNDPIEEGSYWRKYKSTWRDLDSLNFLQNVLIQKEDELEKTILERIWHLGNWRYQTATEKVDKFRPSLPPTVKAFQAGLINQDDLVHKIFNSADSLRMLTDKKATEWFELFPFLQPIIQDCSNRILEIELKRGDSETLVSDKAVSLQRIEGIEYLVQILQALGRDTLSKQAFYWYASSYIKKDVLGVLLKRCFPKKTETITDFKTALKGTKIKEQRLVEVAMFAPQWIPMISQYLNWKGMENAIWWFHAHTKEAGYGRQNELESDISRYTPLKAEALTDGAVDVAWFKKAYKGVGKKRWEQLYKAAKYICEGSGHRRAQIFADAMLGKLKMKEVIQVIKAKRRQDYVRALGLLPLNRRSPEADVLKRYQLIQQFKKESKQFGNQRQVSESLAVKISLENLARTAGYTDPIRLTWAMETKEAQEIIANAATIEKGGTSIHLKINELGKAIIIAQKGDKILKAIPAKLRKDKQVLQLKSYAKTLQDQYRRTRKSLEAAMCNRDVFELSEIQLLMGHPVVTPMLSTLVLAVKDQPIIGYFNGNTLRQPDGSEQPLSAKDEIIIAHCTDLHQSGLWTAFQRDCFEQKRIQPFKQIFRELYLPTPDELQEKTISRRYAGHQVQPKKTVALLKTRGWVVDRDMGLQKVYHDDNLIVRLYALADWFTPSDVEAPTLETLSFEYRDSYKNAPFESIPPHLFSEVMRDVDLVVSVAHVGGVDPEASHSTVEMRKVLVEETTNMLGLLNVNIKGNHLLINGDLRDYSIHLGSGIVHRQPGGYVSIIPIHSQHRGRLFLPFMDDDPKSAEILSKVLLLAEDQKIQDPRILRQLA